MVKASTSFFNASKRLINSAGIFNTHCSGKLEKQVTAVTAYYL